MTELTQGQTARANETIRALNSFIASHYSSENNHDELIFGVETHLNFTLDVITFTLHVESLQGFEGTTGFEPLQLTYELSAHKWYITTYEQGYNLSSLCGLLFNYFLTHFTHFTSLLELIDSEELHTILADLS